MKDDEALYIDLEDYANLQLRKGRNLHKYVLDRTEKYILIDEVEFIRDDLDYYDIISFLNNML